MNANLESTSLKRGWTTGACAAGAARAAFEALAAGVFPDPVEVLLPGGQRPAFALAQNGLREDAAFACVVKDAGDDPDVTHGALICARVRRLAPGSGMRFCAGEGVGTITKPGLPLAVGEPAINPAPRRMIEAAIAEAAAALGVHADAEVEISVPGGEALAAKTLNPRLGIVGGISILGTTGIVIPYSCSAWIHSIHRGIDVARAAGIAHIAGSTGATSEAAIARLHGLPEPALIEMGDFVGGMLKYVRKRPVARVSIAGGFAKITKLAQGRLDLHSRAGGVDFDFLAALAPAALQTSIRAANTAQHALEIAQAHGVDLPAAIVSHAWRTAAHVLDGSDAALEIAIFNRDGALLARSDFKTAKHC